MNLIVSSFRDGTFHNANYTITLRVVMNDAERANFEQYGVAPVTSALAQHVKLDAFDLKQLYGDGFALSHCNLRALAETVQDVETALNDLVAYWREAEAFQGERVIPIEGRSASVDFA
jgi:hypothetical protein